MTTSRFVGDSQKSRGGFYSGTDNTVELGMAIEEAADTGATLKLPRGLVGISDSLDLPPTFTDYFDPPTRSVRLKGEGSNCCGLVPLDGYAADRMIGFSWPEARGWNFQVAEDNPDATWMSVEKEVAKRITAPSTRSRYECVFPIGSLSRSTGYKVLDRDRSGNRLKIALPISKIGEESFRFNYFARTIDNRISDLLVILPPIEGAVGIRRAILDDGNWERSSYETWNQSVALQQRIQCDLSDVAFKVRSEYHPAAIAFDGSWLQSRWEGVGLYGTHGEYNYDCYLVRADDRLPSGRDLPNLVINDSCGLQWCHLVDCHGGNFPGVSGRINFSLIEGGFWKGGVIGPVWNLNRSHASIIDRVSHEGNAEKPAEAYLKDSVRVLLTRYNGGGAVTPSWYEDGPAEFGDMIRMENCFECGTVGTKPKWNPYGFIRRTDERRCANPGETAMTRMINCRDCFADDFDFDILRPTPGSEFYESTSEMIDLMVRIDEGSTASGCYAEGKAYWKERDGSLIAEAYERGMRRPNEIADAIREIVNQEIERRQIPAIT